MEKLLLEYPNALAAKAFDSSNTRGRRCQEQKSDSDLKFSKLLNPFELDSEKKITNLKSFRASLGKTQVWPIAQNPLVRSRLTHTMEVASIAVFIARILKLNVHLVRAIALAHDLGHGPFGHLFEKTISEITGAEFRHEYFGPILLQEIERSGQGANLSFEVLDGCQNHSRGEGKLTVNLKHPLEYSVVMWADKIAYLTSDINDCLRQEYLEEKDLPTCINFLGGNQRERVDTCEEALIKESLECGQISFTNSVQASAFEEARQWMYKNVYLKLDTEPTRAEHANDIRRAFNFAKDRLGLDGINAAIFLATMTDKEVLILSELELNLKLGDIANLKTLGFMERLPYCKIAGFEKKHLDLSWAKPREEQ